MENDFCHYFIDQPTSWRSEGEFVDIRGWIADKRGEELGDIRAVVGGVVTYGIMGYDRPDILAFMGGMPAAGRSGFWIRLFPWRGRHAVVLEVLRPGGAWTEFHRAELEADGPIPATRPKPVLAAGLVAESLHYLYRHFHFEPAEVLRAEARRKCDPP